MAVHRHAAILVLGEFLTLRNANSVSSFGTAKTFWGPFKEEQTWARSHVLTPSVGPFPGARGHRVWRSVSSRYSNWPAAAHWAAPANLERCRLNASAVRHPSGATQRPIGGASAPLKLHRMREWNCGPTCNPVARSPALPGAARRPFARGILRSSRCASVLLTGERGSRRRDWRHFQTILKCASTGWQARPLIGKTSWGHAEKAMTRSISARSLT